MKKELTLFTFKKILLALAVIAFIVTITLAILTIGIGALVSALVTYALLIAWQSVDKQYRYTKLQRRIMETLDEQLGKTVRIEIEKGLGKTKNHIKK
jgi:Flp pilus assembly protein TadB